ncbi:MAG: nodulation protein NfeD, partial [Thermomicrobiales bacterium]|nr:nodulation protein NfeD [Thermomicrobiales bacterium]
PAIAAILLTIGLNAILFELSSPGGWIAGVIGVVCLLLALYALGTLQANWTGLGFVLLAFALFVLDIKAPTHGALTLAGIASFIFGLYLLFNTPEMTIPWGTIIGLGAATGAFFAFVIAKALLAQRLRPRTGMEAILGEVAVVRRTLEPDGLVFVAGELWRARAESGALAVGERVIVTGYDGMLLHVRRTE